MATRDLYVSMINMFGDQVGAEINTALEKKSITSEELKSVNFVCVNHSYGYTNFIFFDDEMSALECFSEMLKDFLADIVKDKKHKYDLNVDSKLHKATFNVIGQYGTTTTYHIGMVAF